MNPHDRRLRPVEPPARPPRRGTGGNWFLWIFGPAVVIIAGTSFVFKLIEFFYTATKEGPDALGSFLMPVLTYLMVAAGFLCLFFWAYFTGQFRDVEGPKYRMLELQREIDRMESERGSR